MNGSRSALDLGGDAAAVEDRPPPSGRATSANSAGPMPKRVISATPSRKRAGGREALLVGRGLVVADDVVVLQPAGDLRAAAVADVDDHLVRLGVVDGRVAGDVQPGVVQSARAKALALAITACW